MGLPTSTRPDNARVGIPMVKLDSKGDTTCCARLVLACKLSQWFDLRAVRLQAVPDSLRLLIFGALTGTVNRSCHETSVLHPVIDSALCYRALKLA